MEATVPPPELPQKTVADLAGANVDNADYNKRSLGASARYARAKLWEFKGQAAKRFEVDIGALPKTPGTNVRRTGGAGRGPGAADRKDVSPAEFTELIKDKEGDLMDAVAQKKTDLGEPTARRRAAIDSGGPAGAKSQQGPVVVKHSRPSARARVIAARREKAAPGEEVEPVEPDDDDDDEAEFFTCSF